LELFKSFQSGPWLVGEEGQEYCRPNSGERGGEGWRRSGQRASGAQGAPSGVLGRGGDDRRWGSHGGRGGSGEELIGERVPARKWGNAPVQKLQQVQRKLLVRLN
jgi:hypothetical protein